MKLDNNTLQVLIASLEWQINMGVDSMVEEKNNHFPDLEKNKKINKDNPKKLETPQKPNTLNLQTEGIDNKGALQEMINNCLTLEDLKT